MSAASPQQMQSLFQDLFDARALQALAPLIALASGVVACLALELFDGGARLRPFAVIASILATLWYQAQILSAPLGNVLRSSYEASSTTAAFGLLFGAAALVAYLASLGHYEREHRPLLGEHDALLLSAVAGMTLMAGANDLIGFFVGLELLSIPLYALSAFRRSRAASVEAGLKYFLLGAFSSALFLYGAASLYAVTGSVSLDSLRTLSLSSPLALLGVALIVGSLLFKIGAFPFHSWVPDVYQGSPTPITALMAGGTKAAALAFLLRASFLMPSASAITLAVIALITMAIGNLGALAQQDLKRMLAYSGIAHAGTVLLAVAGLQGGDPMANGARNAVLFYLAAYVLTAGGAFTCIALLERDGPDATTLDGLRGLHRRHPWIAACLALFMLSLGGIPGAGGFWGKWFVFEVLVRSGHTGLAIVGALLSVVALAYYLRVIIAVYMQERDAAPSESASIGLAGRVATALCAAGVLATGLLPNLVVGWLAR